MREVSSNYWIRIYKNKNQQLGPKSSLIFSVSKSQKTLFA